MKIKKSGNKRLENVSDVMWGITGARYARSDESEYFSLLKDWLVAVHLENLRLPYHLFFLFQHQNIYHSFPCSSIQLHPTWNYKGKSTKMNWKMYNPFPWRMNVSSRIRKAWMLSRHSSGIIVSWPFSLTGRKTTLAKRFIQFFERH